MKQKLEDMCDISEFYYESGMSQGEIQATNYAKDYQRAMERGKMMEKASREREEERIHDYQKLALFGKV